MNRICQILFSTKVIMNKVSRYPPTSSTKTENPPLPINSLLKIILKMSKFEIGLLNNHLLKVNQPIEMSSKDVILQPTRFVADISLATLNEHSPQDETTIEANLEAINLVIGFREIDYAKKISSYYLALINNLFEEQKREEKNQDVRSTEIIVNREKLIEETAHQETLAVNKKVNMNSSQLSTLKVSAKMPSIKIILKDDTGLLYMPMLKMEISHTSFEIKTIAGKQFMKYWSALSEEQKQTNQCKKIEAATSIIAHYFNPYVFDYEPILEPINFAARLIQITPESQKDIEFRCLDTINVNISYASNYIAF